MFSQSSALERSTPPAVVMVDTTELRWFADGPLPGDIVGWFTCGGAMGHRERRTDAYRIDGHHDMGLKRRFRNTLELKSRRAVGSSFVLHSGLAAPLEAWRRCSPADGLIETAAADEWIDVHKLVYKRRFSSEGKEQIWFNGSPPELDAGCDLEVAAVSVGDTESWSFALAAFGLPERREHALRVAWKTLIADNPCPVGFGALFNRSCGYPEWLSRWESAIVLAPARQRGPKMVA